MGPTSMSMAAAVTPYMAWMSATAAQCERAANQATAAAAAYETAYALTVPLALVAANRAQLMALIATNLLGQNTPAIMVIEAQYMEMWAQDATAMYNYAAHSASASAFSIFAPPPQTTNPGGLAGRVGARRPGGGHQVGGKVQATTAQLISAMPQALQGLATPGSSSAAGTVAGLGSSAASAPASALSSLTGASGKTATKGASAGLGGTLSSLASSLTSVLRQSGASGLTDLFGTASDVAGLGADGAGLGADGGGLGFDGYGLSLDFAGLGSISGADGVPGLGAAGGLGSAGPLPVWARLRRRAWAMRPHSGPCRCRRVGPRRCRRSHRCPHSTPLHRPGRARRRRPAAPPPSPSCLRAGWSGASPTVQLSESGSAPR
jgi:hypothetical protein